MRAFIQLPWAAQLLRRRVSFVFSLGLLLGLLGLGIGPRTAAAQTVYPKGALVSPQPQPNGSGTATFQVTNYGSVATRYSLTVGYTGAVTSATLVGSSLLRVNAGATVNVTVNFTVGSYGDGQVLLTASDDMAGTSDQGTVSVSLPKAQPQWTQDHTTWYTGQNVSTNYPWFHLRNQGDTPQQFGLSVSCSGNISNCAVSSPAPSLSPGSSTDITVSYTTGPASAGSGTIQLTATSSLGSPATTSLSIVPLSEAVQVTPKGGTTTLTVNGTTTVPFTVRETGNNGSGFTYTLTASCSGVIVACTFPGTGTNTMTLGPAPNVDQAVSLTLRGTSDLAGGPGSVSMTASYTNGWGQTSQDWGSYSTTIADARTYTVSVTSPPGSSPYTAENVSTNYGFTVTNTGNTTALYNLSVPTCSGTQSGCTFLSNTGPTTTTVTVAPNGGSVSVPVYYTSRAAGQNAILALRATYGGATATSPAVTIVPLSESVAVSASASPQAPVPGASATYGFTVSATGNNTSPITYRLTASCSGALSCSARPSPDTVTITPGSPAGVSVPATATSSLAGGAGSVTLTATYTNSWGQVYSGTATVPVTVPDVRTYRVQVAPKNATTTYSEAFVATNTLFTVTNNGNAQATYAITQPSPCTGQASGTSCTVRAGYTSVTVDPGQSATIPVDITTGAGNQVLQVYLRAEATANPTFADTGSVRVVPIDPSVRVEALGDTTVGTGAQGAVRFRVTNVGTGYYTTYHFQVTSCPAPLSACSLSADSLWVPPDTAKVVTVSFTASGTVGSSPVTLRAYTANTVNPYESSATNTISVFDANSVAIMSVDPGLLHNRDLCLTISAGQGAAYECGDLRLVHPLPTTRTMNRAHTPVLIYNSQQAAPHPIAVADVRLPSASTPADLVTVTLKGAAGQDLATTQWPAWAGGTVKRIAIGFDASSIATGRYPYTLTVSTTHGDVQKTQSASGAFLIVNRSNTPAGDAPFGAGWWVAGLERLPVTHPDTLMWVGGDGSARVYARAAGSAQSVPFRAQEVDRPDSITFDGTSYTRWAEHRLQVRFDANGRHVQTINRLGHVTGFGYTSTGKFGSITLPPSAAGLQYVFQYQSGIFTGVSAPGARSVGATVTGGLLRSITDPDTTTVQFAYAGVDARIRTRTDRLLHPTSYDYDAASRLSTESIAMAGAAPIVTTFRAAEGMPILNGPSDSADVSTRIIGPRGDTTTTRFWLDRFGQANVIEDALQHRTTVVRDSRWPALAGRVTEPNGHYVTAVYDEHGNLKEHTDHNPLGDGRDAITGYTWDLKWDFVTSETLPEGEITTFEYNTDNGNRKFQQPGTSLSRRVAFGYDATTGLLTADTVAGVARTVEYDPMLHNVSATVSARGIRTMFDRDAVGRVTIVRAPIDSLQQFMTVDTTDFDAAGRVFRHVKGAPAYGMHAAEQLIDRTSYDREGRVVAVRRWQVPDPTSIGVVKDSMVYDDAGRVVRRIAPDGQKDSTSYDPAGNAIAYASRRGLLTTSKYDALNRLWQRSSPSVQYSVVNEAWISGRSWAMDTSPFPKFSLSSETAAGEIPGDVAAFTYDDVGHMTSADNADAKVHRGYYPGGALKADTLMARNTLDASFGHIYVVSFGYDRNGRRTLLRHPAALAFQGADSALTDVRYGYNTQTGALETVTDMFNNVTQYNDDVRGRLTTLILPGMLTEQYGYDDDDQLRSDTVMTSSNLVGDTANVSRVLRATTLVYDARGKVLAAGNGAAQRDTLRTVYGGLGQADSTHYQGAYVQYSYVGTPSQLTSFTTDERMRVDAFGNRYADSTASTRALSYGRAGGSSNSSATRDSIEYASGTGQVARLRTQLREHDVFGYSPLRADGQTYDESGNLVRRALLAPADMQVQAIRYAYYDAAERLRAVDDRLVWHPSATDGYTSSTFEEYRYDALGRRIWSRARTECKNSDATACVLSDVRRTVWDGAQELYEIRHPGGDTLSAAALENDVAPDTAVLAWTTQGTGRQDLSAYFGRVAYVAGRALDQPVEVVRFNYGSRAGVSSDGTGTYFGYDVLVWTPAWSWRGTADNGALAAGPAGTSATSTAGTATSRRVVGGAVYYVTPPWNDLFSPWGQGFLTRPGWWGGLLDGRADQSGQRYHRARYYDPETGHFTQEDPIGLAGGLNAYGFAAGDPVNYSDPFGLMSCPPDCRDITAEEGDRIATAAEAQALEYQLAKTPYVMGGSGIGGADCIHFCKSAQDRAGLAGIPLTQSGTYEGNPHFKEVPLSGAQRGDVLWQPRGGGNGHVGIFLGRRNAKGGLLGAEMGNSGARTTSVWGPKSQGGWFAGGDQLKVYRPLVPNN